MYSDLDLVLSAASLGTRAFTYGHSDVYPDIAVANQSSLLQDVLHAHIFILRPGQEFVPETLQFVGTL
jgi:hypothetical protein